MESAFETAPVSFRIERNILKKFDEKSHTGGYSRAEMIRELIRRFVSEGGAA